MAKYNELNISSTKKSTRVGRGISAGKGKTAGRGTKGQGARKSGGVRPGFEGGQMPLYMRIPKLRGFTSHRPKATVVYTGQLDNFSKPTVDTTNLAEAGLIEHPYLDVKIVVKGDLKKKLNVNVARASASAVSIIEKAGGKFTATPKPLRPKTTTKTSK